ncbi:hypothetical protein D9V41_06970 [Aeromicrobium phragmitis]|uniref:Uncharacterized protein n=1 Tax=Aeromicrobium phragmitis TaxID=2478914 RepID=A0A3L8PLH4_9ACTN|nr:hypothetical protein [Aeromicrobium phragmitis]RLV56175.1 hypothetical protein D9V41_06970 [Aeromicrobium phragmitis]
MTALRHAVLVLVLSIVMTGCAQDPEPTPEPTVSYTPIADEQLYADITRLPGVQSVDLDYVDSVTAGRGYIGSIVIDDGADAAQILDHAIAILRQGQPDATMTIHALRGDERITPRTALDLTQTDLRELENRYGPQPGDGQPPEVAP